MRLSFSFVSLPFYVTSGASVSLCSWLCSVLHPAFTSVDLSSCESFCSLALSALGVYSSVKWLCYLDGNLFPEFPENLQKQMQRNPVARLLWCEVGGTNSPVRCRHTITEEEGHDEMIKRAAVKPQMNENSAFYFVYQLKPMHIVTIAALKLTCTSSEMQLQWRLLRAKTTWIVFGFSTINLG